jgi:hypothetical protein
MEPGKSVTEPHFEELRIPTLTTVSPQLARYKEFCKNGGVKLYMPVFTLPELLSVGKYLLGDRCVPEEPTKEYSPKQIERRFHQFFWSCAHFSSCAALVCCLLDDVP